MPLHVVALMEASTVTGPAKNLIRFGEAAIARGDLRLTVLTIVRGPDSSSNPFIEAATTTELFARPRHPYTVGLLHSIPRVDASSDEALIPIEGVPPDLRLAA